MEVTSNGDFQMITLRIPAAKYEDFDNCLAAAATAIADERGLQGWNLNPRWEDDERETILVDVPVEN